MRAIPILLAGSALMLASCVQPGYVSNGPYTRSRFANQSSYADSTGLYPRGSTQYYTGATSSRPTSSLAYSNSYGRYQPYSRGTSSYRRSSRYDTSYDDYQPYSRSSSTRRPWSSYTSTTLGNTTYHSGGRGSTTRLGNTYYDSHGGSTTILGNTAYGPSGTSTRLGNSIYNSDGSSSTKLGNTWYHSDGSSSTKLGNTWYHHP